MNLNKIIAVTQLSQNTHCDKEKSNHVLIIIVKNNFKSWPSSISGTLVGHGRRGLKMEEADKLIGQPPA